jgi:heat shock protein HslJ
MQTITKYGFYPIALIIFVLVCTCAGNRIQKISVLSDHKWKLVEIDGKSIAYTGERHPYAVFNPADSQVYGSGGCNRFSGRYLVTGQKIAISEVISTKMACMETDYENDFFRILESSDEYIISGDSLLLKTDGVISARFVYSDSGLAPRTPN